MDLYDFQKNIPYSPKQEMINLTFNHPDKLLSSLQGYVEEAKSLTLDEIVKRAHKNSNLFTYKLKDTLRIGKANFPPERLFLFKCIINTDNQEFPYSWIPSIAATTKEEKDIDMTPFVLLGLAELTAVLANLSISFNDAIFNELRSSKGEKFNEVLENMREFNESVYSSNDWTPLLNECRRFNSTPLDADVNRYLKIFLYLHQYNSKRLYEIMLKLLAEIPLLFEPMFNPDFDIHFSIDPITLDCTDVNNPVLNAPSYFNRIRDYYLSDEAVKVTLSSGKEIKLTNVKNFSCMLAFQLSAALYILSETPWKSDNNMLTNNCKYAIDFRNLENGKIYLTMMNKNLGKDAIAKYLKMGIIQKSLRDKDPNTAYGFKIKNEYDDSNSLKNNVPVLIHEEAEIDKLLFCRAYKVTDTNIPLWTPTYNMHYMKTDWLDDPFTLLCFDSANDFLNENRKACSRIEEELHKITQRNENLEGQCKDYRQKLKCVSESKNTSEDVSAEIQKLRKTISDLTFQLENQKSYNSRLMEERDYLKEELNLYRLEEAEEEIEADENNQAISFEEKIAFLNQYTIHLVGGRWDMKRRLNDLGMNNLSQQNAANQRSDVPMQPDFICMCTRFMSHSMYEATKDKDMVQENRVINFNGTNLEAAISVMYDFITNWERNKEENTIV